MNRKDPGATPGYGLYSRFLNSLYLSTYKADSGCLGNGCRRRTYMTTIVVGELPRSCDPAVSEWGNPSDSDVGEPALTRGWVSWGTEISKYPEEKKSPRSPE